MTFINGIFALDGNDNKPQSHIFYSSFLVQYRAQVNGYNKTFIFFSISKASLNFMLRGVYNLLFHSCLSLYKSALPGILKTYGFSSEFIFPLELDLHEFLPKVLYLICVVLDVGGEASDHLEHLIVVSLHVPGIEFC